MSKTNPIDPNVPAGGEDPKLGDNRIRELAAAVAELLNVDHYMGTDGGAGTGYSEDAAGRHNKVTLRAQTSNPTSAADTIILFAKDVDDKAEAHLKDEDGNVIQLTTAGKIKKTSIEDFNFIPVGLVAPYAGSDAPDQWLLCNGQAVSRETYADLFEAIGTIHGVGDAITTFNVPDLVGYFVRGLDTAGAVDTDARELGSTQTDAFQGHKHSVSQNAQKYDQRKAAVGGYDFSKNSQATITIGSPTTDSVNGTPRTDSETRPVNKAFNYIIKT